MKLPFQVVYGFGDKSTLEQQSDIGCEESGSFEESGLLEEVEEANQTLQSIEEGGNEDDDDQDFWAVICNGTESCQDSSFNHINEADCCDLKSDLKSSFNNSELVDVGESDDESFEAISAIAFLLGEGADDAAQSKTVDESGAACEEEEDFWAKLQEHNEMFGFQNQKSDPEEFSDPNSWSLVGSSDLPAGEQFSQGCPSENERNLVEFDMFDYLEGVTIWNEDGPEENSNDITCFEDDELDYLVGVTIWEEAGGLLNHQQVATEGQTCTLFGGTIDSHSDYNQASQEDLLKEKESKVDFASQESEHSVSIYYESLEDITRHPASASFDKQNSCVEHVFAMPEILHGYEEAPKGPAAAAKNSSSQRFPKHSMIPKPKKQSHQCQKSDSDDLATANVTAAGLDPPGSRRSRDRDREKDRDRDRRRRGRGSLFIARAWTGCVPPPQQKRAPSLLFMNDHSFVAIFVNFLLHVFSMFSLYVTIITFTTPLFCLPLPLFFLKGPS